MSPAMARLTLGLQLDDVDAIPQSLAASSTEANATGERAAFEALHSELVKNWSEVNGYVFAQKHPEGRERKPHDFPKTAGRGAAS